MRVAVVTGGSRGIGREVVRRLVADGYAVLFTHSSSDAEAEALVAELPPGGAYALRVDITDDDAPPRIFDAAEALGEVTALVNNAGITGRLGPLTALTDDHLRRVVDVNLVAPIRLCREAAARWTRDADVRADRSIVNVSSVSARTGSPGDYIEYAATKAGLDTITVGLAKELAPQGIRVNTVSPGIIDTTIHATSGEAGRAARVGQTVPMRRPGTAVEIANAVAWLVSAEASYVTGATLTAAGGL